MWSSTLRKIVFLGLGLSGIVFLSFSIYLWNVSYNPGSTTSKAPPHIDHTAEKPSPTPIFEANATIFPPLPLSSSNVSHPIPAVPNISNHTQHPSVVQDLFDFIVTENDALIRTQRLSKDCDNLFGMGFLSDWQNHHVVLCNDGISASECWIKRTNRIPFNLCGIRNGSFDLPRLWDEIQPPSKRAPRLLDRKRAGGFDPTTTLPSGLLSLSCKWEPSSPWIPEDMMQVFRNSWVSGKWLLDATLYGVPRLACDHYIHATVFFIRRYDSTNLFHALEDLTQTFASLTVLREELKEEEIYIVFVDSLPKGPFFGMWRKLFTPQHEAMFLPEAMQMFSGMSVGGGEGDLTGIKPNFCAERAFFNVHGGRSLLSYTGVGNEDYCSSPILKGFSRYVLSRYGLWDKQQQMVKELSGKGGRKLTIMWISRQPYYKDITHQIRRIVLNEDDLLQFVREHLVHPDCCEIKKVDWAQLNWEQQLEISSSVDILMGHHGAGMAHAFFVPPHAQVIEVNPNVNKHFHNICHWVMRAYRQANVDIFGGDLREFNIGLNGMKSISIMVNNAVAALRAAFPSS